LFAENADVEQGRGFFSCYQETPVPLPRGIFREHGKKIAHPVEAIPAINLSDTSGQGPAGKRGGEVEE
jgi:hypothetical protein